MWEVLWCGDVLLWGLLLLLLLLLSLSSLSSLLPLSLLSLLSPPLSCSC